MKRNASPTPLSISSAAMGGGALSLPAWYVANNAANGQGLVIDETTGRNVAVTYAEGDAPLVAEAPNMARALLSFVELDAQGVEWNAAEFQAAVDRARAALIRAGVVSEGKEGGK